MKTRVFTLVVMFFFICANGQIMRQWINPINNETKVVNAEENSSAAESVWEKVYQLPFQQMPVAIEVVDEETIWASSSAYSWVTPPINKNYLYRSIDGGSVWQKNEMPWQFEFSAIDSLNVWASVGKIGILKTSNGGQTWDTLLISNRFGPIHFFNQNEGIFIACFNNIDGLDNGDSIVIYQTNNGGLNWNLINPSEYGEIIASEACASINNDNISTNGDTLYFTTTRNRIIYTTNKGSSWAQIVSPFENKDELLTSVKAKNNLNISLISAGYMTGASTYVWRPYPIIATTKDGGTTWTKNSCLHLSNSLSESIIPGSDSISIIGAYEYKYGSGGTMISTDYGETYTLIDSMSNLMAFRFLNSNTGFAVTFNNNDSRVADTDYILKWKPGIHAEKGFLHINTKLPEGCLFDTNTNVINLKKVEFLKFSNPCRGVLNITIPQISISNGSIQLYDYTGRQILLKTLPATKEGGMVSLNLESFPVGVYLVKLRIGNEEYSGKVLLIK